MDSRFNQTSTKHHQTNQQPIKPLSGLSSQPFQQQANSPHTLPPLQAQYAVPALTQSLPGQFSAPSTPRTPHTPGPASAPSHSGNFPYIAPQPPPLARAHQSQASYSQLVEPLQGHQATAPTSSSYLPPQSTALGPRPSQSQLPLLQPMPAGGFNQQTSSQSDYPPVSLLPEPPSLTGLGPHPFSNNDPRIGYEPTHVVGSQGRRGILPSAPGRAAAVTGEPGTTAKNAAIPPKDADGKFPCPHCNKTYLHAKHLKRHLLRRELQSSEFYPGPLLILNRYWRSPLHVYLM